MEKHVREKGRKHPLAWDVLNFPGRGVRKSKVNTQEQGTTCRFRLADVICPEQRQAVQQVTPELEVEGEVVFFSDHGEHKNRFAIVEVQGILSPLIVPVECVQRFTPRAVHGTRSKVPRRTGTCDDTFEGVAAHE
jgi:hypothetical protein